MRYLFLVALLGAVVASEAAAWAEERSRDDSVRKMTFVVEVARAVLEDSTSDAEAWLPGREVLIFAPPIDQKRANRPGQEWLSHRPPFLESRVHEFDVQDGVLVPLASIALVGDTVKRATRDGRRVQMSSTSYPPVAVSTEIEPVIRLHRCDSAPVMFVVEAVGKPVTPAYMVVSDHGFGQVTNRAGVAVFDVWPTGCDMQMVIWCPAIKVRTTMTSETLVISPTGKCIVPAGGKTATHTIRVVVAD